MQIDGRHIETSNRDKPFFPEAGLTKGDLVDYYADLGDTMLVHLDGHPVSLQRFPDGLDGEGFYQKDASAHFPDWLTRVCASPSARAATSWRRSSTVARPWSTWRTRR
ncbi:hypothetical protein ACFPTY_00010 [Halomonas beimenensis]|uniref:non-homologous end-joining DNA ligase LigD n=1 Tax=Halomonas beimenensis TaxID=475662 RepID=UPI003614B46F